MITKNLLVAALSVAALGVGSASLAAPAEGSAPGTGSATTPWMMPGPMAGYAEGRGPVGGWMMNGGMMGGGPLAGGGMMGACPGMMGAGLDSATAMRMHGEMMRAMGDILVKYADKAEPAATR